MDSYSADSSSSASFSFSNNASTDHYPNYYPYQQENIITKSSRKPPPAFRAALHSVRRSAVKKQPIAPMPPTPPRIYKVNPLEFKNVVQKLTGAATTTRLREVAPPPLSLSPPPQRQRFEEEEEKREKAAASMSSIDLSTTYGGLSPLGFSLSPASLAWCTAMLLSPTTLASFEPTLVL